MKAHDGEQGDVKIINDSGTPQWRVGADFLCVEIERKIQKEFPGK
jgi:hypothetical protein